MKFTLMGYSIEVDDDLMEYNKYRNIFKCIAQKQQDRFDKAYTDINDFDGLIGNIPDIVGEILRKAVDKTIKMLVKKGIMTCSAETFLEKYYDEYLNYEEYFNPVLKRYYDILGQEEQLALQREYEKSGRSHWTGGGFGFSGAIKGAATAGVLNAGTGMIRGIGDSIKASNDRSTIRAEKAKIFNDPNVKKLLSKGIYQCVFNAFYGFLTELIPQYPGLAISFDSEKAQAIFENARAYLDEDEQILAHVIQCIELYPYNSDYYIYLLSVFSDAGEEIGVIAEYFGYKAELNYARKILVDEFFSNRMEKVENCNDCIGFKIDFTYYASQMGLTSDDTNEYVQKLDDQIDKFKIKEAKQYYKNLDRSNLEKTRQSYDLFQEYLVKNEVPKFPDLQKYMKNLKKEIDNHKLKIAAQKYEKLPKNTIDEVLVAKSEVLSLCKSIELNTNNSVVDKIDEDIYNLKFESLKQKYTTLAFQSEAEALDSVKKLRQLSETLELPLNNPVIHEAEQIIQQFDLDARSIEGVEFSNRDMAALAREEYKILEELRIRYNAAEEFKIGDFINELNSLSLQSNLKEQYIHYFQSKSQLKIIQNNLNRYFTPRQIKTEVQNVQRQYPIAMDNLIKLLADELNPLEQYMDVLRNRPEKDEYEAAYEYIDNLANFDLDELAVQAIWIVGGFFGIKILLGFIIGSWSNILAVIYAVGMIGKNICLALYTFIILRSKFKSVCRKYGVNDLEPFE